MILDQSSRFELLALDVSTMCNKFPRLPLAIEDSVHSRPFPKALLDATMRSWPGAENSFGSPLSVAVAPSKNTSETARSTATAERVRGFPRFAMRCLLFVGAALASEWAILKLDNYTMPMLVGKELSAFVRPRYLLQRRLSTVVFGSHQVACFGCVTLHALTFHN